ncbi:probable DNA primase large subunit [Sitophilus oryzae]|uniref:Probable DNA primase large subunit n=1 Tax=Sitophilus oryzae TaxID=7048 RepID=A0A6J2XYH2_SITOR|nr:probable DNA primase large subunit [Sitophilus oryzae]
MSFYLRPPKGITNIINLETTVRQRFLCYQNIINEDITNTIVDLECLVEDSVLDRLGHHLFRLLALKSRHFYTVFIEHEVQLLGLRLASYNPEDAKNFVKSLKSQCATCLEAIKVDGKVKNYFIELSSVCLKLLSYFRTPDNVSKAQIQLHFSYCFDLLAKRQYDIANGMLLINCTEWKALLLSLYKSYLHLALFDMKFIPQVNDALQDERIKSVLILARDLFCKNNSLRKFGSLDMTRFEEETGNFPLCMKTLYNNLSKNNRLGHNARFDFSLYLKDIGVEITDAFEFWRKFYSKQHSSCSSCTHSWEQNEKRYIYGIRHLYGLEGSRKSYNVKDCSQIQNTILGANEEGGCPFQHFDDNNLRSLLKNSLPVNRSEKIETIINERRGNPKKGCEKFLDFLVEKDAVNDELHFKNPAEYYFLLKSINSEV